MGIYEELGIRTVINAAGTVTRYGGSVMAPEVLDIIREAAQEFCLMDEVHERVGLRIAKMLDVEAAYVTSSACCGLVLTAAACMAGADPEKISQLPDTTGMKNEVIILKPHRIAYDQAIRLAGATLVEVDGGASPAEALHQAIHEQTAAVFYLANQMHHPGAVPLDEVIAMAHEVSVPVIVDAASECPPLSTLTRFSKAGADLVIFSGGKSIMGPQSTGLVIGRKDLVAACAANGTPFPTIGRPMKVSREEVIAFMKALELYLARDHEADMVRWNGQIGHIEDALAGLEHLVVERLTKSETYAVPMLHIRPNGHNGFHRAGVAEALLDGEPHIAVAQHFTDDGIVINPHMLKPGEEQIVAARCQELLG